MGGRFAARLLAHGFALVGYDTSRDAIDRLSQAGGRAASSVAEVADLAETVLVSLPTPESVFDVACGPGGLHTGSTIRTYVDLSTTGPTTAEQVADRLSKRNIQSVDAPVSGG